MEKLPVMAGTVGEGTAREFYSYCKIYGEIPTIEEILKNPEICKMGDEPSMHYALAGLVSHHMTLENADVLIEFLGRMAIDFQVVALRSAMAKDNVIKKATGYRKWVARNAHELL